MSESKKGVHQISPNSFLFFNTPEIFYYISFEQVQETKIRIILIKIKENLTNIFGSTVDFSEFGTGDISSHDTIKNLDFIIYNYNFVIKEERDKAYILINTKNPKNIELSLYKLGMDDDNMVDLDEEQMNKMENKIKDLMNVAENQEQEICQLEQNESMNVNKIKKLKNFTDKLLFELENKKNGNQANNNYNNKQYNNNQNNNNKYNNNQHNYNNQDSNRNQNNNNYNNNNNNPYKGQNNFNNPYMNNDNNNSNNNIAKNPYLKNNNEMNNMNNIYNVNKKFAVSYNPNFKNFNNHQNNNNNNISGYNPYD